MSAQCAVHILIVVQWTKLSSLSSKQIAYEWREKFETEVRKTIVHDAYQNYYFFTLIFLER